MKQTKTVKEITQELENCRMEELEERIASYQLDARKSVQQILERSRKKKAAYEAELERTEQMKCYEKQYSSCLYICGIDEAGRGPLAGPVAAGAVILPKDCDLLYINDSKQLSAKKREELYDQILECAISASVGIVGSEVIDSINILQATYEAMRQAIGKLTVPPDLLLNDAVRIPGISIPQVPIVKGDAKSISIAAASILAKVTRDRMMIQYDEQYPEYGFAGHKGYGSQAHIDAIRKYGPCPIHRKTFIHSFL